MDTQEEDYPQMTDASQGESDGSKENRAAQTQRARESNAETRKEGLLMATKKTAGRKTTAKASTTRSTAGATKPAAKKSGAKKKR